MTTLCAGAHLESQAIEADSRNFVEVLYNRKDPNKAVLVIAGTLRLLRRPAALKSILVDALDEGVHHKVQRILSASNSVRSDAA